MRRYRVEHARPDAQMRREGWIWTVWRITTEDDKPSHGNYSGGPTWEDPYTWRWFLAGTYTWEGAMALALADARRDPAVIR